jgi:hypothetical protein
MVVRDWQMLSVKGAWPIYIVERKPVGRPVERRGFESLGGALSLVREMIQLHNSSETESVTIMPVMVLPKTSEDDMETEE